MIIEIESLSFEAIIGLLPNERVSPQRVEVDIEISYSYPALDLKGGYIDYAKVVEIVKEDIISSRYLLLEDAIYSLRDLLKGNYPNIETLTISISKPNILPDCRVKVKNKFIFE